MGSEDQEIEKFFCRSQSTEGVFRTLVADSSMADVIIKLRNVNAVALQEVFLQEARLLQRQHRREECVLNSIEKIRSLYARDTSIET